MKKIPNIFVIDNDPVSNFVCEKIISFLEIADKITPFLGGEDALDYMKQGADLPDLILLDLDMPCMNGFEFLKAMKKLKIDKRIEIVILTTSVYNKNIDFVKSRGLKFYVAKPLDIHKMKEVYKLLLSNNEPQEFVFIS